jgi:TRAP-type C4-dicarboxylate transport system substrate-binding protein
VGPPRRLPGDQLPHREPGSSSPTTSTRRLGGKLKITVHANASLFKANEIKRAVQGGQAQIGEVLLVNFENENPIYGADGIPFLAASYAEVEEARGGAEAVLDKLLAAQGMMLLYTVPWPPQGIYVKKEIASVADMRGLKWRAYSPATGKIAELIGAQPVTVQAAELSQALATGRRRELHVVGLDRLRLEDLRVDQVLVRHPGLAAEERRARQQAGVRCARQADAGGGAQGRRRRRGARRKLSEEKNDWYKKALAEKGMKIMKPPAKLMTDMRQVGTIMLADWEKKAGADGQALVGAYRK